MQHTRHNETVVKETMSYTMTAWNWKHAPTRDARSEMFVRGTNEILNAFPIFPGNAFLPDDEKSIIITIDGNDYGMEVANPFNLIYSSQRSLWVPKLKERNGIYYAFSTGMKIKQDEAKMDHPAVILRSEINLALKRGMTLEQVHEIVETMLIEKVMEE